MQNNPNNVLEKYIKEILINKFNISLEHIQSILIEEKEIFITLYANNIDDEKKLSKIFDNSNLLANEINNIYPDYKIYVNLTKRKQNLNPLNQLKTKLNSIKKIIIISSGKGGVGKSTATINLAYAMKSLGYKIGILDGDIYGPSINFMMGDSDSIVKANNIKTFYKDDIIFNSIATFMENKDTPIVLKAPIVLKLFNQLLVESAWGNLDYLFIDMPPGTGDVHINLALKYEIYGNIIVCTPQQLALLDAKKAIAMWEQTGVKNIGVIENMSSFVCSNCNHITHIFDNKGLLDLAKQHNINYLGDIPLDTNLRQYSDSQTNSIKANPNSIIALKFIEIAKKISLNTL